jgi:hypothetical protein
VVQEKVYYEEGCDIDKKFRTFTKCDECKGMQKQEKKLDWLEYLSNGATPRMMNAKLRGVRFKDPPVHLLTNNHHKIRVNFHKS